MDKATIQAGWQATVDQALALGLDQDDVPTGVIEASTGGDNIMFRSHYTGA